MSVFRYASGLTHIAPSYRLQVSMLTSKPTFLHTHQNIQSRFQSTTPNSSSEPAPPSTIQGKGQFEGLHIISIPITTSKSYISCHRPITSDQEQKYPWINKVETKAIALALKAWTKLSTSKASINVKVTKYVQNLLDTIPYEENCLKSFPPQKMMIRDLKQALESKTSVVQTEIDRFNIPLEDLKPIPVYHPGFQSKESIIHQLDLLRNTAYKTHKKYAILCAIGIPLTLPFALVPILPNIPGFYLAYRLYCNVKALVGVKHLDLLLKQDGYSHLTFATIPSLDKAYSKKGEILLDEKTIDNLCALGLSHLKDDLHKALKQETARLKAAKDSVNSQ